MEEESPATHFSSLVSKVFNKAVNIRELRLTFFTPTYNNINGVGLPKVMTMFLGKLSRLRKLTVQMRLLKKLHEDFPPDDDDDDDDFDDFEYDTYDSFDAIED